MFDATVGLGECKLQASWRALPSGAAGMQKLNVSLYLEKAPFITTSTLCIDGCQTCGHQ